MKLIVGLGNPGTEYENTRHNVGFLLLDRLVGEKRFAAKKAFKGEVAEVMIGEEKVLLLKPTTFMNRSGEAVRAIADFYKIPLTDIIVVHDDADLPFGDVRIQQGRSAAGHNGVQSIIDTFGGSLDFHRVRVGIGRPAEGTIPLDVWVLGAWSVEERQKMNEVLGEVVVKLENKFV